MLLLRALLLFVHCGCFVFAASAAATAPGRVHEARQGGPKSIPPVTFGPGPASLPPQSSNTVTMSATPSEPSVPLTSLGSPKPPSSSSSPSGNSASPSPSSSSDTPQPSSSPTNLSLTVQNMTACQSSVITWTYGGQSSQLLLSITNIGVSQDLERHRLQSRQSGTGSTFSNLLVETNTSPPKWTWPSVNVSQGWYEIEGLVFTTGVSDISSRFFVTNGTDVSCLTGLSSPQPSPSPASGNSSPSSSSSNNKTSTIAGSVVGAIVGAALLAIVATWFWLRRRRRIYITGSRLGRRGGRWGSLKSNNSDIDPRGHIGGTLDRIPSHHSHTESMGAMLQDADVGKVSSPTTPGGSHEDVAMMGDEKLASPSSPPGMSPLDVLNTPVQYDRRTSMYSIQNPTAVADNSRPRTRSVRTSNQSLEQQAHRIRSSMDNSFGRRGERLSMPTVPPSGLSRFPSSSQAQEEYPLSPLTAAPVNRSISTGAVSTTHRTPRKPVPQYDPFELREEPTPDSVSTFTTPAESSHSHGSGSGKGTAPNGSPLELSHKASFGDGRPVHYLIPDMPLPQAD